MAKKKPPSSKIRRQIRQATPLKKMPTIASPHIPLMWIDTVRVARRHDQPVITVTGLSIVNEALVEFVRMQFSLDHFVRMAALFGQISKDIMIQIKSDHEKYEAQVKAKGAV